MIIRAIDRIEFGIDIDDYKDVLEPILLELKEKKDYGHETGRTQQINYGNTTFEVGLTGIRFYAYKITCKDFMIAFAEKLTAENPPVRVILYSGFLWSYGYEEALNKFLEWFRVFPCDVAKTRLSRLDICLDIDEIEFFEEDKLNFKTRAKVKTAYNSIDTHTQGQKFSGFSIGRGQPMLARIYNKSLEIKSKGKEWFKAIWKENGWKESKEVWRIEYQVRRIALKELGIDTVRDIKEKEDALWKYLTTKWLYLDDQKWSAIEKTSKPDISPLIRKKVIKGDLLRLTNQTTGLLVSIGAYTGIDDLDLALKMVKGKAEQKYLFNNTTYAKMVRERRNKNFQNQEEVISETAILT